MHVHAVHADIVQVGLRLVGSPDAHHVLAETRRHPAIIQPHGDITGGSTAAHREESTGQPSQPCHIPLSLTFLVLHPPDQPETGG